jgi:hypothetical protein
MTGKGGDGEMSPATAACFSPATILRLRDLTLRLRSGQACKRRTRRMRQVAPLRMTGQGRGGAEGNCQRSKKQVPRCARDDSRVDGAQERARSRQESGQSYRAPTLSKKSGPPQKAAPTAERDSARWRGGGRGRVPSQVLRGGRHAQIQQPQGRNTCAPASERKRETRLALADTKSFPAQRRHARTGDPEDR